MFGEAARKVGGDAGVKAAALAAQNVCVVGRFASPPPTFSAPIIA